MTDKCILVLFIADGSWLLTLWIFGRYTLSGLGTGIIQTRDGPCDRRRQPVKYGIVMTIYLSFIAFMTFAAIFLTSYCLFAPTPR